MGLLQVRCGEARLDGESAGCAFAKVREREERGPLKSGFGLSQGLVGAGGQEGLGCIR